MFLCRMSNRKNDHKWLWAKCAVSSDWPFNYYKKKHAHYSQKMECLGRKPCKNYII